MLRYRGRRRCSARKFKDFSSVLHGGTFAGSTSRNSTLLSISLTTYDALDLPPSSQPRGSSLSTPSFGPKAFTQIARHPLVISRVLSHKAIAFDIC